MQAGARADRLTKRRSLAHIILKRDERTFHRYCVSAAAIRQMNGDEMAAGFVPDNMISNSRYHQHARINCLQRASR